MRQTGNVQGIAHRRRNRIAFASEQRGRDRTLVAGNDGADALVDRLAHAVDGRGETQPGARLNRRRHRFDRAQRITGRADALEIHVAREVVAAGPQRRQRRRQMRFELDKAADRRRGALAHRDADAVGHLRDAPAFDAMHADDDAVAALALLADFDKAGERHARGRELQHRMRDARGLERGGGKAGGDGGKAERERKTDGAPARHKSNRDAGERGQCRRRPGRPVRGRR